MPSPLDAVLISHAHQDHLHRPSLRDIAGPAMTAVVPRGTTKFLRGLLFAGVHELRAGEARAVAGVQVRAVEAWHPTRRLPGAPLTDAVGFVVDRIWFAGDTDMHPDMEQLRGTIEVALLPIWGWGTSLGPGHMDPARAAEAVAIVRPEMVVPIHWGTFLPIAHHRRHSGLLVQPAIAFEQHAARLAPDVAVRTLRVGETLTL